MKWVVDSEFEGNGERWLLRHLEHTIGAVTKSSRNGLVSVGYGPQIFSPEQFRDGDPPIVRGGILLASLSEAQRWCEDAVKEDILPRMQLAEIGELA